MRLPRPKCPPDRLCHDGAACASSQGFDENGKPNKSKSLNDFQITGPELVSNLTGVLLRFRNNAISIMGDIDAFFHCCKIQKDHRGVFRFLWVENPDDPDSEMVLQMTVHVFGAKQGLALWAFDRVDPIRWDLP